MDRFDDRYIFLEELYEDSYYPDYLVDKIKLLEEDFINYIEAGEHSITDIGDKIYDLVINARNLQDNFLDEDSEYDNHAREHLLRDLDYIIRWYKLPINLEKALSEREWE